MIAPINAVLNWLLGLSLFITWPADCWSFFLYFFIILYFYTVWGPEPVRLGFIGAPIASAISYNLIAIASIIYGFYVPKTAWHPITWRMFTKMGFLCRLGFAGVGQVGSEWWSWELVGRKCSPRSSYMLTECHVKWRPVCVYLNLLKPGTLLNPSFQLRAGNPCGAVDHFGVCLNDLSSTIRAERFCCCSDR